MNRLRLRYELHRRAVLRTDQPGHEERHASWLELFYDLAFVGAIGMLGTELASDLNWETFGRFLLLFVPLWWAWVGQTFYLSRFDADDLIHRLFSFAQIFFVVSLAVTIPQAMDGDFRGYLIGFALLRLLLIGQYLYVAKQIPKARPLAIRYVSGFSIGVSLWLIAAFSPLSILVTLWLVAFAIDFYTPFSCPELAVQIPPDYSHFPERFGLFTIIVLGEGILGALNGLRRDSMPPEAIAAGGFGLLLFCAMWWVYFEGVKGTYVEVPKDVRGVKRLIAWLFAHLPMTLTIVLVAVCVKKICALIAGKDISGTTLQILGWSALVLFVCMHLLYVLAWSRALLRHAHRISRPHVVVTGLMLPVAVLSIAFQPWVLLATISILAVAHVVLIVIERPELRALSEANERARQGLPHEFSLFG